VVAAERRELEGVLARFGASEKLAWPGVKFARAAEWKGDRWWLIANGPGPRLIEMALAEKKNVNGIISTGFCGALDPALQVGDIVVPESAAIQSTTRFVRGGILTSGRVAVTASEKHALRNRTGAAVVEMEAAAVKNKAEEWGVPFLCVRVVSDTAADDLPLDFNRYRNGNGDFSRSRIALAAMARPFSVMPRLIELDRNCRRAAHALGDFLADCRF
jgi:adenosylhomocysteine nucleosidase